LAIETQGRHVALDECQPGGNLGRQGGAPLSGQAEHRAGPVDPHHLEA